MTITILSLQIYVPASTCIAGENAAFVRVSRHFELELSASLQAILEKNKMKPTNPNAHTYVNGTDVKTHGYAVTHNTFLQ